MSSIDGPPARSVFPAGMTTRMEVGGAPRSSSTSTGFAGGWVRAETAAGGVVSVRAGKLVCAIDSGLAADGLYRLAALGGVGMRVLARVGVGIADGTPVGLGVAALGWLGACATASF